jgi:hypothetical protein
MNVEKAHAKAAKVMVSLTIRSRKATERSANSEISLCSSSPARWSAWALVSVSPPAMDALRSGVVAGGIVNGTSGSLSGTLVSVALVRIPVGLKHY